jgi:hypothetical protein
VERSFVMRLCVKEAFLTHHRNLGLALSQLVLITFWKRSRLLVWEEMRASQNERHNIRGRQKQEKSSSLPILAPEFFGGNRWSQKGKAGLPEKPGFKFPRVTHADVELLRGLPILFEKTSNS